MKTNAVWENEDYKIELNAVEMQAYNRFAPVKGMDDISKFRYVVSVKKKDSNCNGCFDILSFYVDNGTNGLKHLKKMLEILINQHSDASWQTGVDEITGCIFRSRTLTGGSFRGDAYELRKEEGNEDMLTMYFLTIEDGKRSLAARVFFIESEAKKLLKTIDRFYKDSINEFNEATRKMNAEYQKHLVFSSNEIRDGSGAFKQNNMLRLTVVKEETQYDVVGLFEKINKDNLVLSGYKIAKNNYIIDEPTEDMKIAVPVSEIVCIRNR